MSDSAQDRDPDWLGLDDLLAIGLSEAETRAVLAGSSVANFDELPDRLGMLQREQRDRFPEPPE
jgi:hypothetical protein